MRRVLVTGANGFIGRHLCQMLIQCGYQVNAVHRRPYQGDSFIAHKHFVVNEIGSSTDWEIILQHIDFVVHLAARVHDFDDTQSDSLGKFRKVNRDGTVALAKAAVKAGVCRFVYLSSIKVNGDLTVKNGFTEDDTPQPQDSYGQTKWESEQALRDVTISTNLEVVIIRPPLVYGPEVKANFYKLMHIVYKGIPLPLSNIQNRRSFISIGNLVDLIICCLEHPHAAGETFLASDREDLSTPDLIIKIANSLGIKPLIFPIPLLFLNTIAAVLGKNEILRRLTGSLQINSQKATQLLGWTPPYSVDESLSKTANWYKQQITEEQ